ncbi:MAG: hypothetical protein GY820_43895, partial [Gammaproteobacteria bacterium]|nr:hypothetical protein [Gammaproteobacteria bacterium]
RREEERRHDALEHQRKMREEWNKRSSSRPASRHTTPDKRKSVDSHRQRRSKGSESRSRKRTSAEKGGSREKRSKNTASDESEGERRSGGSRHSRRSSRHSSRSRKSGQRRKSRSREKPQSEVKKVTAEQLAQGKETMKRFVQSAEGGAGPQHYPQSAEGGSEPLSDTVGKSKLGPHPNADLQHLSAEQLSDKFTIDLIRAMGMSEQNAQKAVSDYKQGYIPVYVDPKAIPLPSGPPPPPQSAPSTPQRKVVLKPEAAATPGYPGFDHLRAVGLAQG